MDEGDGEVSVCVQVISGELAPGVAASLTINSTGTNNFSTYTENMWEWSIFIYVHSFFADNDDDFVILEDNIALNRENTLDCFEIEILDDRLVEEGGEMFNFSVLSVNGPLFDLITLDPYITSIIIVDNDGKIFLPLL